MGRWLLPLALAWLALGAIGCSYPIRNDAYVDTGQTRYEWRTLQESYLPDTLVIFTASGGGTRATALSMAVLTAMDKIKVPSLPPNKTFVDNIDIISSVSGGSVTAAWFALKGKDGLPTLESSFVRQDGIGALLVAGLNPVGLAALATPSKERIDLVIDYFDRQLFAGATFQALIERGKRPMLILNAADMVEGTPFPFTQYTMDLLCSDLAKMRLSTAVAASTAFPVALSPVTLKNYAKCADDPTPPWIREALRTRWDINPPRVAWARTAEAYASGSKRYIHLLDGGIADNLGVSEPYRLLTTSDVQPRFMQPIADGRIKKIIFVMVNARSFPPSDLDRSEATPGMIDMLLASLDSAIDRATFGTSERIRLLLTAQFRAAAEAAESEAAKPPKAGEAPDVVRLRREMLLRTARNYRAIAANAFFIAVDFDAITDARCRSEFHKIKTSWTLPAAEIDALKVMGEALFADNRDFSKAMHALGAQPSPGTFPTIAQGCAMLGRRGE